MSPKTMRILAKPMLLATTIMWGGTFFVTKNALDVLPVFFLQAVRFSVGAVLLALVCWKKWKGITADYLWRGAMMGSFIFFSYTLQNLGLAMTTPSKNAFLTAVCCIIVPFLSWAVIGQRPDRFNIAAALMAVTGVGLVCLNEQLTINAGDLLTLASAFVYAGNIVVAAKVSHGKDIYLLTVIQFATAAAMSWLCAGVLETFTFQSLLDPTVLWPMAYLGVLGTAVGCLFQNVGVIWTDPASASMILSLESVFGVLFSVLFYGDRVNGNMLMGFIVIFVAVVCSETKFSFLRKKPVPKLVPQENE